MVFITDSHLFNDPVNLDFCTQSYFGFPHPQAIVTLTENGHLAARLPETQATGTYWTWWRGTGIRSFAALSSHFSRQSGERGDPCAIISSYRTREP